MKKRRAVVALPLLLRRAAYTYVEPLMPRLQTSQFYFAHTPQEAQR